MRALIERVEKASCNINGEVHSSIEKGLLVYIAFEEGDNLEKIKKMAYKIQKLRIFEDDEHKMNKSIEDINGEILLISSFSLYGDALSGNRPSFTRSLKYSLSLPLYELMKREIEGIFGSIKSGVFGADMKIEAINDGPVSIIIDL